MATSVQLPALLVQSGEILISEHPTLALELPGRQHQNASLSRGDRGPLAWTLGVSLGAVMGQMGQVLGQG